VRGRVPVRDQLLQYYGIVHGGVYASIAETLASLGTAHGVAEAGAQALGMSNNTSFLRPVSGGGTIDALARRRHGGRTTWIWDVDCSDAEGRLCASSRVTIAVRAPR
jgi:uncharacterized protein (TIGR00369 family)